MVKLLNCSYRFESADLLTFTKWPPILQMFSSFAISRCVYPSRSELRQFAMTQFRRELQISELTWDFREITLSILSWIRGESERLCHLAAEFKDT